MVLNLNKKLIQFINSFFKKPEGMIKLKKNIGLQSSTMVKLCAIKGQSNESFFTTSKNKELFENISM